MNAHQRRVSRRADHNPVVHLRAGEMRIVTRLSFVQKLLKHPRALAAYATWVVDERTPITSNKRP